MQFLYDYFSVAKCLNATMRHSRLCRSAIGGSKYEQAILPFYNDMKDKEKLLKEAINDSFAALDMIRLCDSNLDDLLITINHRCEDYDKVHIGSFTRTTLFPKGNYGEITSMNMYKEPAKASEIANKIESFGATHELYPFAAELKKNVKASEDAIAEEKKINTAEGLAKANAEIVKLNLIKAYNSNYYKAADEGGKEFAEKLFPVLKANDVKDDLPEDEHK